MFAFVWNLRLRLGYALLPGSHKHVKVAESWRECGKCR